MMPQGSGPQQDETMNWITTKRPTRRAWGTTR